MFVAILVSFTSNGFFMKSKGFPHHGLHLHSGKVDRSEIPNEVLFLLQQ